MARSVGALGPVAGPVPGAERQQPDERGVAAEFCRVLVVEGGGVAGGVGFRGVGLGSPGAAPALAGPAHHGPLRPEAVAVAEDPAAEHTVTIATPGGRAAPWLL